MNIYITKENEEYLRGFGEEGESMSGYINRLLENARNAGAPAIAAEKPNDDWGLKKNDNPLTNGKAYARGARAYEESVIKTKEDARKAIEPLWRNKKKGIL